MTRAAALALLLACAPPARRPPPELTPAQLAVLDRAERHLARLAGAASRLRAAQIRVATTTGKERQRAFAAYLAASQDLGSRP